MAKYVLIVECGRYGRGRLLKFKFALPFNTATEAHAFACKMRAKQRVLKTDVIRMFKGE